MPAKAWPPGRRCGRMPPSSHRVTCATCFRRRSGALRAAAALESLDLLFDYSRQRLTRRHDGSCSLELAQRCGLEERIAALFAGSTSTHRAPCGHAHGAAQPLRTGRCWSTAATSCRQCTAELATMRRVRHRRARGPDHGHRGAPLHRRRQHRHRRLRPRHRHGDRGARADIAIARVRLHCVSNVDGVELADVLEQVDPAQRRCSSICSKTFTTLETLTNARPRASGWSRSSARRRCRQHFVAVSTNARGDGRVRHRAASGASRCGTGSAAATRSGPPWVCRSRLRWAWSRSSRCSQGGHEMDEHFRSAPLGGNLPVLMGLIGVWNTNFLGATSLAVLPYDSRLHRFPAYLQQLEMESNGKGVTRDGRSRSTIRPARSSGASPATTRSIRSSSCCTRAPRSCRWIFSRR